MFNAKRKFVTSGSGPNSDDEEAGDKEEVTLTAVEKATLAIVRRAEATTEPGVSPSQPASVSHNYHGVVEMFQAMLYAKSEPLFFDA